MGLFNSVKTPDNTTHTVSLPYGYCETAAGTAAKTVTVPNVSELTTGLAIIVRFKNSNSASSPTLNVNGLGAKNIYRYGTTKASTSTTVSGWTAGAVQLFVYNGSGWVRDYWSNTTYTNAALGQGFAICDTEATDAAKVCSISSYALTTGGIVTIQFTHGNIASNPTLNIAKKGAKPIYYNGGLINGNNTFIQPDDICTFMYDSASDAYHLLANDRWYKDIQTLDEDKMDKTNPIGYGTLSINRRDSSVTDDSSIAIGWNTSAMGSGSFAEGTSTKAVGTGSHAEGYSSSNTIDNVSDIANPGEVIDTWQDNEFLLARGNGSHAEGYDTLAYSTSTPSHAEGYKTVSKGGYGSHSEGYQTWASGRSSHAEGEGTTAGGESSHAEGYNTTASGHYSHAEGTGTSASSSGSHAEGSSTSATGSASHAEGSNTVAEGIGSHAEGGQYVQGDMAAYTVASYTTKAGEVIAGPTAYGHGSHAEGGMTFAAGVASHAEGIFTEATKQGTHAEGYQSEASGNYSHAEGYQSKASGNSSHAEGSQSEASGNSSHAEGNGTQAFGYSSHAEGSYNRALGAGGAHAEGYNGNHLKITPTITGSANATSYTLSSSTVQLSVGDYITTVQYALNLKFNDQAAKITAITPTVITVDKTLSSTALSGATIYKIFGYAEGDGAHSEGYSTIAKNRGAHAEGCMTIASGAYSHAEGFYSKAIETGSHAEGNHSEASGTYAHAEGYYSKASGSYTHAEGSSTTASGSYAHAEGANTVASGEYAHAEGQNTQATASGAHAEGGGIGGSTKNTTPVASGVNSHVEGSGTQASKEAAHAEGIGTKASSAAQHVQGKYNIEDTTDNYAHIVGNGDLPSARSNAHTLDWNGNAWFKGEVKIGGTGQDDTNAKTLATTEYVDNSVATYELITIEDIDTICGGTIQSASEVTF